MKNVLRKVVIILMSVITTMSMGSCAKINNDTAKDVCNYLENRYNCKFTAMRIGDRMDKDTAKLYVYPDNSPEIIFTAIIDRDGNVYDDYVPSIIADKVEKSIHSRLSDVGIKCTVSSTIADNSIEEKNTEITVEEFVNKYNINSIYAKVIFDGNATNAEAIIDALESAGSALNTNLSVRGYIFEGDSYLKCKEAFLEYPYVGPTTIKQYSPVKEFLIQVKNGKADIRTSDLKKILGE